MAGECGECGTKHKAGRCPMAGGATPQQRPKKAKVPILDNLSKEAADGWVKRMGTEVSGPSESGRPKKRHYESVPDPANPGKFKLVFVED